MPEDFDEPRLEREVGSEVEEDGAEGLALDAYGRVALFLCGGAASDADDGAIRRERRVALEGRPLHGAWIEAPEMVLLHDARPLHDQNLPWPPTVLS